MLNQLLEKPAMDKFNSLVSLLKSRYNYDLPGYMNENFAQCKTLAEKITNFHEQTRTEQSMIIEGSTYEWSNPKYLRNMYILEALRTMSDIPEALINKEKAGDK